ncbi:hypothetical protein PILCRDRAFT_387747 [Piloderma croceum F 1598]|uniref:Uncharacterized protein n=1 Tax=Piloderma croceum (strain F 1598) TaxID=765440 RepID=A0A0C3BE27_PILCF|nr:hypothetical protein PILCRDRAFT_387747 [Piloderma croceum F 1598]
MLWTVGTSRVQLVVPQCKVGWTTKPCFLCLSRRSWLELLSFCVLQQLNEEDTTLHMGWTYTYSFDLSVGRPLSPCQAMPLTRFEIEHVCHHDLSSICSIQAFHHG